MTHDRDLPLNSGPMLWPLASVFVVALGYGVALPLLPFLIDRLHADSGRFSVSWHVD